MSKANSIVFFENGNVAVFDKNGEQIPEMQDGWLNWEQIKKLAKIIADNPDIEVKGTCTHLSDYVKAFERSKSYDG